MDYDRRGEYHLEQLASGSSQKVAEDVSDDDDGGRELELLLLLVADDQEHSHRQDRQEDFVSTSGPSDEDHRQHVQQGEQVDDPGCAYGLMF